MYNLFTISKFVDYLQFQKNINTLNEYVSIQTT